MVGFLCNPREKRPFSNYLRKNSDLKKHGVSVIIFSIQNINFNDKTVCGTMISNGKVTTAKTTLPSVVFNFAIQYTKSHIKKLKLLSETEDLTLVNPVNSFNQWSIMELLSSDFKTKQYILPYADISYENVITDIRKIGNFIIKPKNGSNLKKIIYCKKTDSGYDLYNIGEIIYSHLFDIKNAIIPAIRNGKWILITSPELITNSNRLLILRNYLQRTDGKWKIILRTAISQTEKIYKKSDERIDAALLRLMGYINCFIPDLAFCTIDFVLSSDGTPFFLSLGGWQDILPQKIPHRILFDNICKSLIAYAKKMS